MTIGRTLAASVAALWLAMASLAQATPSLVVDVGSERVLHAEEAGRPWFPASITKLMTAYVVFEQIETGRLAMDSEVVLSRNAVRAIPVRSELPAGSAMTMEDALYAILGGSANDVAVAIGETVAGGEAEFARLMNDAAARLGMTASRFANANGAFDQNQYTTARDIAVMALEMTRRFPAHMRFFDVGRVEIGNQTLLSYNDLLTRFPGTHGMKTGFLCASGRNIVALTERDGRTLLAVVLGATTDRERSERAAQLLTQAFAGGMSERGAVREIANEGGASPTDMRRRLCTDDAAAYESEQARAYPMGLGNNPSYLGEATAPRTHVVSVWQAPVPPGRVPVPTPRPAID